MVSQAAILSGQEQLAVSAADSLLRAVDANRQGWRSWNEDES